MNRTHFEIVLAVLICCLGGAGMAHAEPPRVALVIANAQYSNIPPLAGCVASAAVVRDGLLAEGYEVIERSNLGRGEFDTAIGLLARRTASTPPPVTALYYCGYGLEFKDRPFVLPTSATLARDNDVLTQGILAKSIIDSLRRAPDSTGFILLDVFAPPGVPSGQPGKALEQIPASSFAVIMASNDGPGGGTTAASLALRDEIAVSDLRVDRLVQAMRGRLAKSAALAVHGLDATGSAASAVIGRRAPAIASKPASSPPTSPPVAVAPPLPAALPEPAVSPPPSAARPRTLVPDEEQMSEQERRLVQTTLATMGYYAGRIDATFGPETRAAIRRYQFEIKAELTGRLTGEQATRLVNGAR